MYNRKERLLCQAHATKQNYILAMKQLSKVGFVSLVQLMLAVPAERKGKDSLVRQVTSDYRIPARPDHAGIDWSGAPGPMAGTHTLIFLAEGAEVTRAENAGTYGNVIDITAKTPCWVKGKAKDARVTIRRAHAIPCWQRKGISCLWGAICNLGHHGKKHWPICLLDREPFKLSEDIFVELLLKD